MLSFFLHEEKVIRMVDVKGFTNNFLGSIFVLKYEFCSHSELLKLVVLIAAGIIKKILLVFHDENKHH